MDEKHVAIHEAGHVVACVRLGIDIGPVSIIPGDDTLGCAFASDFFRGPEDAELHAISDCSGYAALIAAGYSQEEAEFGCDLDFEKAKKIAKSILSGSLDDLKNKAFELMVRAENISAVNAVADALLLNKRLDEDVCLVLIELADGEITEAEFQRYIANRNAT